MRRRQVVEIEDLSWCPRVVRDGGTDWLGFMANATGVLLPVAPKIRAAMAAMSTTKVIDLCSGGGGPWLTLAPELARSGPVHVELSDLYPNVDAFNDVTRRTGGLVGFRRTPVDATDVGTDLDGVRTVFAAFHHFPPDMAVAILADAVRKRRAIVIVEAINHRGIGLASMPLQLPAVLLFTLFVRPFRLSRLFFTYLIPLIPLLVLFDGTMSMLRLYLDDDLRALVARVPGHDSFVWDIGTIRFVKALPVGLIYLIGTPKP
jgi:hypothetical protein